MLLWHGRIFVTVLSASVLALALLCTRFRTATVRFFKFACEECFYVLVHVLPLHLSFLLFLKEMRKIARGRHAFLKAKFLQKELAPN